MMPRASALATRLRADGGLNPVMSATSASEKNLLATLVQFHDQLRSARSQSLEIMLHARIAPPEEHFARTV